MMFVRKEVIITLVALLAISSSVAYSEDKLTKSLDDDVELIAALASHVNDGPQLETTLELPTKPAQAQREPPEAADCICDKAVKPAESKATQSKKALKNGKSDKKLATDKKSGKKFKVITVTVPVDRANEDLEENSGSDVSEKMDKVASAEIKLDAPVKEAEEDQETAAIESQKESEKEAKSKGSTNDAGKEKESLKRTKIDKKRSKRDAKPKLSKSKKSLKSKGSKKNKSNNKK